MPLYISLYLNLLVIHHCSVDITRELLLWYRLLMLILRDKELQYLDYWNTLVSYLKLSSCKETGAKYFKLCATMCD